MYNSQKPKCKSCKCEILFVPKFCCSRQQLFCLECSLGQCKKCKGRRRNIPINAIFPYEQKQKFIKCYLCLDYQSSNDEFFYESKCKLYYCHSCIIKLYERFTATMKKMEAQLTQKVQLPVDLSCGCEISKQSLLSYLHKYCYYCSEKLSGNIILLKNQCKITKKCYDQLKMKASRVLPKQEDIKGWKFIDENVLRCMNCQAFIDGERKILGNKVDDFYLCSLCLQQTKLTEKQFGNRKRSNQQEKSQKYSSVKKQVPKLQAKVSSRVPIELGRKNKPHLANGNTYFQTRCKFCKAGIEKLLGQQQICEVCIQLRLSLALKDTQDPRTQIKIKKEQLFENQKNLLVQKVGQNIRRNAKQSEIEQKQQKIPLLEDKSERSISIQSDKRVSNEIISIQRQEEENNQIVQLKQLKLKERQSSVNEQFLPFKVQKIKIGFDNTVTKCCKCNYALYEQCQYKAYQKQSGKQQSLRIAQSEQEAAKYLKQNKLLHICNQCFLSQKWKLKLFQDKNKKQLENSSSRYRSVPKKAKIQDPVALTHTNLKKVDQNRKYDSVLCHGCHQWKQTSQLNEKDRMCSACVKKRQIQLSGPRNICKKCSNFYVRQHQILDSHIYCRKCMFNLNN